MGKKQTNPCMGVCRWDTETLTLYYTMNSWILQPYSTLGTKNPYPIPD